MADYQWIEGGVSVQSVLAAKSRDIAAVAISEERYDTLSARIQQMARSANIPVERVPIDRLKQYAEGVGHGGIMARVGPRHMTDLLLLLAQPIAVTVMLDGVEDPFNFGQAVRSLYAAGVEGVVVRPRNWLSAASTVIRASAGATEFMPMAAAETSEAIEAARARGVRIAVATDEDAHPMYEVDLAGPLLLIIGGEKRGVARAVRQAADTRVAIPYGREFSQSLGSVGAAAVLAFEIFRQRRLKFDPAGK